MPVLETKGALSAQGYGLTTTLPQRVYIEDVFSTWLYTGNGSAQGIGNGIQLGAGATSPGWISFLSNSDIYSTAVDNNGNVYICGMSRISGVDGLVLAKYNTNGILQWQRRLAPATVYTFNGVATDSSGNSYICGVSDASGSNDIQIAKYDANGVIQWQRRLGGAGDDRVYSIAIGSSGNVYVCGTEDFSGTDNILIAKYDTSGTIQWQRRLGGTALDRGYSVTVDSSENVYICGTSYAGSVYAIQIAKYNTSGTLQWQRRLGPGMEGYSIISDSSGNIYVCGGQGVPTQVAKYDTSGTLQWQRQLSSVSTSLGQGINLDASGNVYVCGYNISGSVVTAFVVKYNTSGTIQWQRELSANQACQSYGVSTDSSGNVYIAGTLLSESFLAKLPGDGSGVGVYTVGSVTISYAPSSMTDVASTLTSAASTLTSSTASLTSATSTLTDSASTLTSSTTALIEGPAKGGLVWMKGRSGATDNALYDTARGATFDLASNLTSAQTTQSTGLTGFLANGFSIGSLAKINTNAATYVSWTFRKQPRFFDVVTWTGDGFTPRVISHNLGSVPGCIIAKRIDASGGDWYVYHRSLNGGVNAEQYWLSLNSTAATAGPGSIWDTTAPTATGFNVGAQLNTLPLPGITPTYVAYLFAHNAGGFGATGADNVISCGSYSGNGSATGPVVTLGYEPQWLLIKRAAGGTNDWNLIDNMRGFVVGGTDAELNPNLSSAESTGTFVTPTATGFQLNTTDLGYNASGGTYIYIAIRRGPMRTPTTGTSVFGLNARTGTGANATVTGGQIADAALIKNRGSAVGDLFAARLTGTGYLETSSAAAEVAAGTTILQANPWDVMDGIKVGTTSTITNASGNTFINYLFRRAPGFFDVVCYTGTGSAGQMVNHNLGVVPELMIVKNRSQGGVSWSVYSSALGATNSLFLNLTTGIITLASIWNNTAPTASVFTIGNANTVNVGTNNYVAYLFASCPGVSKVGSYTGTGATQTINCGFTAGARFVLIKRTGSPGDWYVWDTARGIVAGNDPYLLLNSAAAEVTNTDWVDTAASGFELSNAGGNLVNINGASYIFLSVS